MKKNMKWTLEGKTFQNHKKYISTEVSVSCNAPPHTLLSSPPYYQRLFPRYLDYFYEKLGVGRRYHEAGSGV